MENRLYLFYIAIGHRMKDNIKAFVVKRQAFGHIRLHHFHLVPFPLGNHAFTFTLLVCIAQHGTFSPQCRKNGDLLPAAACKPQQLFPLQLPKTFVRHDLGGG